MVDGWRIPQNFQDYIARLEKRLARLERRPSALVGEESITGPGLTAQAVQIMDWSSSDAILNGYYWTAENAINTPDPVLTWTGQVIAKDDGTGMQQVWNTDGPQTLYWMRTYAPDPVDTSRAIFTAWKKFATASGFIGEPELDPAVMSQITDPVPPAPLQTFSTDPPPADPTGYDENHAWWQVDAEGDVLGFWRLVGGAWIAQTITTVEALNANNVLVKALDGTQITGATVQTRSDPERGVKMIAAEDKDGNPIDAFYVFDNSGTPFIKAVPNEGMAVIAGEVVATTATVFEGASLGGITEVTRGPVSAEFPDGYPGAIRLTGYTTAPKSAPIPTTGYDTVQFTNDGLWNNRRGWATDGTYWYTTRSAAGLNSYIEKWDPVDGTLEASAFVPEESFGVVYYGGYLYALLRDQMSATPFFVNRFNSTTLADAGYSEWPNAHSMSTPDPAIGVDSATGDLIIAQSRSTNSDKVRIRHYSFNGSGPLTSVGSLVDTGFGYDHDLSGISYGAHDLGTNRYIFSSLGTLQFQVASTIGDSVPAEDWQSGMSGKVGFTYAGGVFVSMDRNGLMRTYTGEGKATASGDASMTKWVSNTLANATYETDQSPAVSIAVPKRTKLNVATSAINTGGDNAPDQVKVYVGRSRSASITTTNGSTTIGGAGAAYTAADVGGVITGTGIPAGTIIAAVASGTSATLSVAATATGTITATIGPGRTGMWKQTDPGVGVTTVSYPSLATSGTNPPATNGFVATTGTLQRVELADGTPFVNAVGEGSWAKVGEMKTVYGSAAQVARDFPGWLIMDGSTFLAATYPKLEAWLAELVAAGLHKNAAGAALSSTTLPDMRDRAAIGASGTRAVGTPGGAASKTIAEGNLPVHVHGAASITVATSSAAGSATARLSRGTTTAAGDLTPLGGNTGGGGFANTPLDVMNPYIPMHYLIRAV